MVVPPNRQIEQARATAAHQARQVQMMTIRRVAILGVQANCTVWGSPARLYSGLGGVCAKWITHPTLRIRQWVNESSGHRKLRPSRRSAGPHLEGFAAR